MNYENIDILKFFLGECKDNFGRTIYELQDYIGNSFKLEHDHKYIQMLFPIDVGTKFNAHASILTSTEIQIIKQSPALQRCILRSLDMMLDYYGFRRCGFEIEPIIEITPKNCVWLKVYDHNQLRITRILRCLTLTGFEILAGNIYETLCSHAVKHPRHFTQETLDHWHSALLKNNEISLESY